MNYRYLSFQPAWFAVIILMPAIALSGCGMFKTELDKCHEKREYQTAQPAARAKVPDDLEALDDASWVPVPYGEVNTAATPAEDPCLIEPPDYRDADKGVD